jgi:hypothetical protein
MLRACGEATNTNVIVFGLTRQTEILLKVALNTITHYEIIPTDQYKVYRNDRDKSRGGGVLIAVRKTLISSEIFKSNDTELLAVKIHHNHRPTVLAAYYRPPTKHDEKYLETVYKEFTHLKQLTKNGNIWIAGDFNLPDIDWKSMSVATSIYPIRLNKFLLDTIQELDLEQVVNFPTRQDNILDLVLTSHPSLVNRCKPLPGISDHDIVLIDANVRATRTRTPKRKIYLWKTANTQELQDEVRTNMEDFSSNEFPTIDDMWTSFKNILLNAMEKSVPSKLSRSKPTHPWITTEVRRIINKKNKAGNKARKTKSQRDKDRYRKLKSLTQRTTREAYNDYVTNIISPEQTNNPKRFWSFIKSKKQDNSGVAPLRAKDGIIYSDNNNKAEILNNQFKSAYTLEDTTSLPNLGESKIPSMPNIHISENGVHKLLSKLNDHKAAGPDAVPPRLLRQLADIIAPALTRIFQTSLDKGAVPKEWRTASVVPIFKKGDKSNAANYRPVSLTAICSKLQEHILCSNIMDHLTTHNILSDSQHGFRS